MSEEQVKQKKKHFPWVEVLVFVALGGIIFSVIQPNFAEFDSATMTAFCKENQRNIEQATFLWLTLENQGAVERGIGDDTDTPVHDVFGDPVVGMLHYSDTHPNAEELVEMGVDPAIFICPEVGEGQDCLGRHYCYTDSEGNIECAMDAAGKARQLGDEQNPNTGEYETLVDFYHD
jgi:hypothetical protein